MIKNDVISDFSLAIGNKKSAKRNKKELKHKGFITKSHYF